MSLEFALPPMADEQLAFALPQSLDPIPRDTLDHDDSDIYRGDPPPLPRSPSPDSMASSTSSSSSSSGSFLGGGRLGAIAAVVELAITRWARGNLASSSSSSSSSSRSSIITVTRSQLTRRRRRRSSIGTHSMQSERDITARITRIKAREESRQVPREFALYLPPSLTSGPQSHSEPLPSETGRHHEANTQRMTWTTSLPLILNHLDVVLKKTIRVRRYQGRNRSHKVPPSGDISFTSSLSHSQMSGMTPQDHTPSSPEPTTARRGKKGKQRDTVPLVPSKRLTPPNQQLHSMPKAWFLDVASPTWEDLRSIGKLLHLHPLTLEDILQQDPREKLELFPKLGYYFISFRAIETQSTRERTKWNADTTDLNEGGVGEANVYLVVFNEGICSFHYTDISEHTDRIRNRIVLLEEVINMSSDWIAHGILDSIVDSFFPFLEDIGKEVLAIDDLVFSGNIDTPIGSNPRQSDSSPIISLETNKEEGEEWLNPDDKLLPFAEKNVSHLVINHNTRTRFSLPRLTLPIVFRRFKRIIHGAWKSMTLSSPSSPSTTTVMRRMARTRRLVTSLARLLATKSEVVSQIRKRLLTSGQLGLGNGTSKEDVEVAIYMGDVQDHILTLQHSLAHYERMLTQSHPTYLSQLRTTVAITKSGTDKAIIFLTLVSIGVLCIQTLIGSFSLNITVPSNGHAPDDPYYIFGIVIALASVILCIYLSVVRCWWIQAKRRRAVL